MESTPEKWQYNEWNWVEMHWQAGATGGGEAKEIEGTIEETVEGVRTGSEAAEPTKVEAES